MTISLIRIYECRLAASPKMRKASSSLLCFDPGETTGWAHFQGLTLTACGQLNTSDMKLALNNLAELLRSSAPEAAVIEDYRVYGNKAEYHVGASLHTPRVIGILETLLMQANVPYHKQMASLAKQFATDDKLESWGLWQPGKKHARDAIRHGAYFIVFPPKTLHSELIQHNSGGGHHVG